MKGETFPYLGKKNDQYGTIAQIGNIAQMGNAIPNPGGATHI